MEFIPEEQFLTWAAEAGIIPDPHFSAPRTLIFAGDQEHSRFWMPPPIVSDLPGFIGTALDCASETGPYCLYRRGGGTWYDKFDPADGLVRNEIIDRIVETTGVPEDFAGAIKLAASEWKDTLTLISAFYVFGWSIGEDLHIVPDDRSCVLMVSHHGELQGQFPTAEHMEAFVAGMARRSFYLPDHVPDTTLKQPDWMRSRQERA